MKKRFIISLIAAVVYVATYTAILATQNEPIIWSEILLGGFLFLVAFFGLRTWLDQRREQRDNTEYEKEN